ncbi:MAG: hypothetical protein ACR2H0_07205, partial [Candidatus Limnocylindrales bacterium]
RQTDDESQTGTGTPRSADGTVRNKSTAPEADTGDPALGDELRINRSGSGGSGGPSTGEDDSEGSTPASMEELLGGDPKQAPRD